MKICRVGNKTSLQVSVTVFVSRVRAWTRLLGPAVPFVRVQSQGINGLPLSSAAHLDNNHHDLEACDFHPFAKSLQQCTIYSSPSKPSLTRLTRHRFLFRCRSPAHSIMHCTILRVVGCLLEQSLVLACPSRRSLYLLYSLRNGLALGYFASDGRVAPSVGRAARVLGVFHCPTNLSSQFSLANSHSLVKLPLHFPEENPRVDWRPIFGGFLGNVPPRQNQKYSGAYGRFPAIL